MTNETIEGLLSRCEQLSLGYHDNSSIVLLVTADAFADLGTEYGTRIERTFRWMAENNKWPHKNNQGFEFYKLNSSLRGTIVYQIFEMHSLPIRQCFRKLPKPFQAVFPTFLAAVDWLSYRLDLAENRS
jgi:hypothetical protein